MAKVRSLSVVIPALNEEDQIGPTIRCLQDHGLDIKPDIILVDGQSSDNTVAIAQQMNLKVLSCNPGRGTQLNAGLRECHGEWVLFCHADTQLPIGYGSMIEKTLQAAKPNCCWGAFEGIRTDVPGVSMRIVEWGVRWRTRLLWLPYGDQVIFAKNIALQDLGGFKDQPLLEDVDLVIRLQKRSAPAIVPSSVLTSGRRWTKLGVWKTLIINQLVLLGWKLGWNVKDLASFYYRNNKEKKRS